MARTDPNNPLWVICCCGCLPFLGIISGVFIFAIIAPYYLVVFPLMALAYTPRNVVLSYKAVVMTKKWGPNLKCILFLFAGVPALLWPAMVAIGSLVFALGWGLAAPTGLIFDNDWTPLRHLRDSFRFTSDLCKFHHYQMGRMFGEFEEPLRRSPPYDINLIAILVCLIIASVTTPLMVAFIAVIGAVKVVFIILRCEYLVLKYWLNVHDDNGIWGCMTFPLFCISICLAPVLCAAGLAVSIVGAVGLGFFAGMSPLVDQDWGAVCTRFTTVLRDFDTFTNKLLFERDITCFAVSACRCGGMCLRRSNYTPRAPTARAGTAHAAPLHSVHVPAGSGTEPITISAPMHPGYAAPAAASAPAVPARTTPARTTPAPPPRAGAGYGSTATTDDPNDMPVARDGKVPVLVRMMSQFRGTISVSEVWDSVFAACVMHGSEMIRSGALPRPKQRLDDQERRQLEYGLVALSVLRSLHRSIVAGSEGVVLHDGRELTEATRPKNPVGNMFWPPALEAKAALLALGATGSEVAWLGYMVLNCNREEKVPAEVASSISSERKAQLRPITFTVNRMAIKASRLPIFRSRFDDVLMQLSSDTFTEGPSMALAESTWACSICTFANPAHDSQCNMCEAPRG